jgi:hypothetical protein
MPKAAAATNPVEAMAWGTMAAAAIGDDCSTRWGDNRLLVPFLPSEENPPDRSSMPH